VQALKEWNIDVSQKTPKRLTEALVNEANKVVVISKHTDLPDYLKKSDKVIYWKIEDPDGKDYEFHKAMRDQIDQLVRNLIPTLH
jgi:protein-tyrosine-phosphatase